jgi:RNA polymerase sigma-54 factor
MHPVEPETDPSIYIRPDVEIVKTEDGYTARLLEHALPHVSLSAAYTSSMGAGGGRFVNEGIYYANRLIYCLEHRNATLLAVIRFAAGHQSAYLAGKTRARLPMSDAATELGVNRSTVSRAVAGKYVLCNNRVFPASDLFTRAGKGTLSRENVCELMRGILNERTDHQPISDRALAELLEKQCGVSVSRRTVNKYRAILARSALTERNRL